MRDHGPLPRTVVQHTDRDLLRHWDLLYRWELLYHWDLLYC
jgi:hypothetical protein